MHVRTETLLYVTLGKLLTLVKVLRFWDLGYTVTTSRQSVQIDKRNTFIASDIHVRDTTRTLIKKFRLRTITQENTW